MSQLSINNTPVTTNLPLQVLENAPQPILIEGASRDLFALLKTKRYVATATCVLEHIIMTPDLTPDEKRFWLLIDHLANIELNSPNRSGKRQIRRSISSLATMLGISRRTVLRFQKSLVNKGYLIVEKGGIDKKNRKQRNLLTPILPEWVFIKLDADNPNKHGLELLGPWESPEKKRAYLDNAKLFVRINFNMLQGVLSHSNLNSVSTLMWMCFYIRSYINQQKNNDFIFHETVSELAAKFPFSENAIRKAIKQLASEHFISYEEFKRDSDDSFRKEKRILIIGALLPNDLMNEIQSTPNRKSSKTIEAVAKSSEQDSGASSVKQSKFSSHHQTHLDHHQPTQMSLHSNKYPSTNHFDNKHDGDSQGESLEVGVEISTESQDSSIVIDEKTKEDVSTQAQTIIEGILDYQEKCKEAQMDEALVLQMYSQRLSANDKDILTTEATKVYGKVEDMLEAREQEKTPSKQTFKEFLTSNLLPYELFLYFEFLKESSKILNRTASTRAISKSQQAPIKSINGQDFVQALHAKNSATLGSNAVKHVENYLKKLYENGDIQGEARQKSLERLIVEVTLFVATWQPDKLFKEARDKRLFQLTIVGNKLREGTWFTPPAYLEADRAQINFNLLAEKQRYSGECLH